MARIAATTRFLVIAVLTCMSVVSESSDDDLTNKNRTYINIKNAIPCIRRFNATHQIGCGRGDQPHYEGVVIAVRNNDELNSTRSLVLNNNAASLRRKLVLVTVGDTFRPTVEFYLQHPEHISGVVLVVASSTNNESNTTTDYSDDQKRPNERFSVYGELTHDWNPTGSGYMFHNFDIPFYLVTDAREADLIFNECYTKFNSHLLSNNSKLDFSESLCGIQLGMQMSGAVSSEVCGRRNNIQHTLDPSTYCDPLGGSAGTYMSFLSQTPSNDKPILLVTARLDAFTLFEAYTPGANEPISSLVGLLVLIDVLSNIRDKVLLNDSSTASIKTNVLFVAFDNEAFDYGGSSRFVNDLANDQFPLLNKFYNETHSIMFQLNKQNISAMMELSQIGSIGLDNSDRLFIHWDSVSYEKNKSISMVIDELTDKLTNYSSQFIKKINNINQQLPPSSLHSFLRETGLPIPGISISDHEKEFKNKFYHGIFDTPASINITYESETSEAEASTNPTLFATRLQQVVAALAKTIYSVSVVNSTTIDESLFQPDLETINKLVYCFFKNASCLFFQNALGVKEWASYKKSLDSSVSAGGKLSFYTSVGDILVTGKYVTLELFKYFSRDRNLQELNVTECDKSSPELVAYQNKTGRTLRDVKMVNNMTMCVATSVYKVSSVSPAFAKFDSDGVLVEADKYSAWSESSWDGVDVQVKLFMFPDRGIEGLTIGLGIVTLVLAILPIYLMNKYSTRVFGDPNAATVTAIADQSTEVFT